MLNLQTFLKNHTLEQVAEKYAITVRRHFEYPNLVLFKYSMIDSPLDDPLVQECRGIILDESKNWEIVSFPYKKFFNHGEKSAAKIDWTTARVYEKVDGSLMTLYWYDEKWHVASSGTPDAIGEIYGTDKNFKGLFWKVWNDLGYVLPTDTNLCYMFELCTVYNKIVVQHPKPRIVFHGARNIKNLQETSSEIVSKNYNWEVVRSFPLQSLEQILATCDDIKPTEGEGYVICDNSFNRIKVKTPQYVAISHMRDGMGSRRMLEVICAGESEEVLTYFPEFKLLHDKIKASYDNLVEELEKAYVRVSHIPKDSKESQKEFALAVKDIKCNGVLFHIRKGTYTSVKEALKDVNIKNLMKALKVKDMVIEI